MDELLSFDIANIHEKSDLLNVLNRLKNVANSESKSNSIVGRRYYTLMDSLLKVDPNLLCSLSLKEQQKLWNCCFTDGPLVDSFIVLIKRITGVESKDRLSIVLKTLKLLSKQCLGKMFVDLLNPTLIESLENTLMTSFCQSFVSLPDKVASLRLSHAISDDFFGKEHFFRLVAVSLQQAIKTACVQLEQNKDTSLKFFSELLGKIQMAGFSRIVMRSLVPFLSNETLKSHICTRIAQKLLEKIQWRALEGLVVEILYLAKCGKDVARIVGDINTQPSLSNLICHHIPIVMAPSELRVVLNIFGLISQSSSRSQLLLKLTVDLLKVWSDKSSFSRVPQEKHLSHSWSIALCCHLITTDESTSIRNQVLSLVMNGIQNHISSTNETLRIIGMRLGEILSDVFTRVEDPLKFDCAFDETEDSKTIQRLYKSGLTVLDDLNQTMVDLNLEALVLDKEDRMELVVPKIVEVVDDKDSISDDDLVPMEAEPKKTNNDFAIARKTPRYLRECMEGLFEEKDSDFFEACLKGLEPLIKKRAHGLIDCSVELAKILLCIQNRFCIEDFDKVKHSTLVSLCCEEPVPIAQLLTSQFIAPNYGINTRAEILDVLRTAGWMLSKPAFSDDVENVAPPSDLSSWNKIVFDRVQSHTKYKSVISSGLAKSSRKFGENKFANLVGHYFFPLAANYDRKVQAYDPLGIDAFLLGRLLFTLASFIQRAPNSHHSVRMCGCLLEIVGALFYHEESVVRQACLFSLITVLTVGSPETLVTEHRSRLIDFKSKVETAIDNEPIEDVKQMAKHCLLVLMVAMKQGVDQATLGSRSKPVIQILD